MARRRMFSLDVTDTDLFLEMPASAQALYFHLGMHGDDDGFVSAPNKIMKTVNCSADDMKILLAKGFLIPFESGVCVIRHWRIHNYIQADRYHETRCVEEKKCLSIQEDVYSLDTDRIHSVSSLDTEVRLGKDRIGEVRREKEGPSRLEKLKKYWNQSGAGPECRLLSIQFRPEDSSDCLRTMSVYTDEEIEQAITIYAGIVKDPEYDPPRYGGFVGFMRGGVEKFIASSNPAETFKIRKKFESAGEREERERAEALARLEAMP